MTTKRSLKQGCNLLPGATSDQPALPYLTKVMCFSDSLAPLIKKGETLMVNHAVKSIDREGIYLIDFGAYTGLAKATPLESGSAVLNCGNPATPPMLYHPTDIPKRTRVLGRAVSVWRSL